MSHYVFILKHVTSGKKFLGESRLRPVTDSPAYRELFASKLGLKGPHYGQYLVEFVKKFQDAQLAKSYFTQLQDSLAVKTATSWVNSWYYRSVSSPYVYVIRHKKNGTMYIGSKYGKGANPSTFFKEYFTSSAKVHDLGISNFEVLQVKACKNARRYEAKLLQSLYRSLGKDLFCHRFLNRNISPGIINDSVSLAKIRTALQEGFKNGRKPYMLGREHSLETRERISKTLRSLSCYNDGASNYHLKTDDPKIKTRGLVPGFYSSPELLQRRSISMQGRKLSEETKRKISENNASRTPEGRKKLSDSHKGYVMPASQRAAIAKANTGKKRSLESRVRFKEAQAKIPKLTCPECGKNGQHAAMRRWHFDNCKEIN